MVVMIVKLHKMNLECDPRETINKRVVPSSSIFNFHNKSNSMITNIIYRVRT